MPRKILIVDDDVLMIEALDDLFTSEGYEVRTAHRGQDALKILQHEKFDLLILDVVMPKITGFEICAQVRKRKDKMRKVKIVMLTAKSRSKDPEVDECGYDLFLTKPIDPGKLIKIIKKILENPSV